MSTEDEERAETRTASRKEGATVLASLEKDGERFEVRTFVEEDAKGLARLFDILGLKHRGVESFKARAAEMWARDLVAENDAGSIVGRVRFEYPWLPYGEIVNPGVDPRYRGRGIGGLLVQGCMNLAGSVGAEAIHLQADSDNTAAHRLYRRYGFMYGFPASKASRNMIGLLHLRGIDMFRSFLYNHPLATAQRPRKAKHKGLDQARQWLLMIVDPLSKARLSIQVRGTPGQVDMPTVCGWRLEEAGTGINWQVVSGTHATYATPGSKARVQLFVENLSNAKEELEVSLSSFYPPISDEGVDRASRTHLRPGQSRRISLRAVVPSRIEDRFSASSYPNIPVTCRLRISHQSHPLPVTGSFLVKKTRTKMI